MKRFLITFFLALLCISCTYLPAQAENHSWQVKHKDRPVVFLLDQISVKVRDDASFITTQHRIVKIQNQNGTSWGEIPIYYNKSRETITHIKAFTITPDGKRYSYSRIQDFKECPEYPAYSDSMVRMITMPEVKVSSLIEYEVTTITRGMPIPGNFWYIVDFNLAVPVKEMQLRITFPKKLKVRYKEFGLKEKPQITDTTAQISYSWNLHDLTENESEEYMPPPDEYTLTNYAEFSSLPNWSVVANWYASLVKKNLILDNAICEQVKQSTILAESPEEKTRAILKFLQEDFRYVSMSFGDYTLEPHPTNQVFRNKYGDCKDLSLLCMAMLESAGIKSEIVLFNNESAITNPEYDLPMPSLFNHVMLLVKDQKGDYFIDPLLEGYNLNEYPHSFERGYAFVIGSAGGSFKRFPEFDENKATTLITKEFSIRPDGGAKVKVHVTWDLDYSVLMRNRWRYAQTKDRNDFLDALDAMMVQAGKGKKQVFR